MANYTCYLEVLKGYVIFYYKQVYTFFRYKSCPAHSSNKSDQWLETTGQWLRSICFTHWIQHVSGEASKNDSVRRQACYSKQQGNIWFHNVSVSVRYRCGLVCVDQGL